MKNSNHKTNAASIKENIDGVLTDLSLRYRIIEETDDHLVFQFFIELETGSTSVYIECKPENRLVSIYSFVANRVPQNKCSEVGLYLHHVGLLLHYGNFEFNPCNGELRVKTSLFTTSESGLCPETFKRILYSNFDMLETFMPGAMQIVYGSADAKTAIHNITNTVNPSAN